MQIIFPTHRMREWYPSPEVAILATNLMSQPSCVTIFENAVGKCLLSNLDLPVSCMQGKVIVSKI